MADTETDRRRQPRGIPTGGEFAAHQRDEATVVLVAEPTIVNEDEPSDYDTWEPQPPKFTFPAEYLQEAHDRIEKANRRLERNGIAERFAYEVEYRVQTEKGETFREAILTLNTPKISSGDWQFRGKHEASPDGSILNYSEFGVRVQDLHCDHCGSNRKRGAVYTLHSETEGDRQVGSSCLGLFLGIRPEGLWTLGTDLGLDDLEDREFTGGRNGSQVTPAEDLLAMAVLASEDGGFVSRANETTANPSTASRIFKDRATLMGQITGEHRTEARRLIEWAKKIDENDPDAGDYLLNLKAAVGGDDKWVDDKHLAISISVIAAVQRAENQAIWAAERAERDRLRELAKAGQAKSYIGAPKQKIAGIEAKVLSARSQEGYRPGSTQTLVKLQDSEGHIITWWASGYKELRVGQTVHVAATVKKHEEYEGDFQAVITRAKLTDPVTGEIQG